MGLFAEKAGTPASSAFCPFGQIIVERFDDDDREALGAWLQASGIDPVVTKLRAAEQPISRGTISSHLNGTCRCPEDTAFRGMRAHG